MYGLSKRLQWPTSQGGFVSASHIGYEGSEPMVIAEEAVKDVGMTNEIHVPRSDNGMATTQPSRVKYMMEIESK